MQQAQWAGPPAGQRGPAEEAELVAEDLAWLQRNLVEDSGVGLYGLYLLDTKETSLGYAGLIMCFTKSLL